MDIIREKIRAPAQRIVRIYRHHPFLPGSLFEEGNNLCPDNIRLD